MKVVLIFLMFTLALGLKSKSKSKSKFNDKPCQPTNTARAYTIFLERHILQKNFDRNSGDEWKKYLEDNNLCDRPRQTFMEKKDQEKVKQICKGSGWLYESDSNLCISSSRIDVYDLKVDNTNKKCQITKESGPRYVVVACDVINKVCRPVHFKTSMNNDNDKRTVKCSA